MIRLFALLFPAVLLSGCVADHPGISPHARWVKVQPQSIKLRTIPSAKTNVGKREKQYP